MTIKWTDDKDDILRNLWKYQQMTLRVMAVRLGCSPRAVSARARLLGLTMRQTSDAHLRWPKEREDRLVELVKQKLTNRQVCEALGMEWPDGKNSIIGKKARLGLDRIAADGSFVPFKERPIIRKLRPTKRQASYGLKWGSIRAGERYRQDPVKVEPTPEKSDGIRIMDLKDKHCRAIVGNHPVDKLAVYCGKTSVHNTSFCQEHYEQYYTPTYRQISSKLH